MLGLVLLRTIVLRMLLFSRIKLRYETWVLLVADFMVLVSVTEPKLKFFFGCCRKGEEFTLLKET